MGHLKVKLNNTKTYDFKKLCLAGGVAHNCSLNGKILYSGMFENIFVQPAAHDAGCAIGAALNVYSSHNPQHQFDVLKHVYLGTDIGCKIEIKETLEIWKNFIFYRLEENIAEKTASLLNNGSIIGWVQGKSEYGPRALGNRSIIADPRPRENKNIINEMVKKREVYRPFAPSVLKEYAKDYFEFPSGVDDSPFMTYVYKVNKDKQSILGAVTHEDGTARIQTVTKDTNLNYWTLIEEFRKISGIPVILNTSFNSNIEPIVDSINDAIVCFLTTKLHYLVIGDYLIEKKDVDAREYLQMIPSFIRHIELHRCKKFTSLDEVSDMYSIRTNYSDKYMKTISKNTFDILDNVRGNMCLNELIREKGIRKNGEIEDIISEILKLWSLRMIALIPNTACNKAQINRTSESSTLIF